MNFDQFIDSQKIESQGSKINYYSLLPIESPYLRKAIRFTKGL